MSEIRTAGELRGFLADVLIGIREKRVNPVEALAIAKVAGEINRSLAVEVQTALQSGVKKPVPGSMVITSDHVPDVKHMGELPPESSKIITENITADTIDPAKVAPQSPSRIATLPPVKRGDGDKLWCDQCEMRVAVSQALACKSPHCKAKEAA